MFIASKNVNDVENFLDDEDRFIDMGENFLNEDEQFFDDDEQLYSKRKERSFSCKCEKKAGCTCCGKMSIPIVKFKKKGCVNLRYSGKTTSLTTTIITLDDKTVFNKTISAHNPPPICLSIPGLSKALELCFDFYDLQIMKRKFNVCLRIEPRLIGKIDPFEVGCLTLE
ncbi:hypothetical protein CDAR_74791 [Caerostris darwini]|uniref:DUF4773 domain-containing protein n=1 Tax=Caerostris darwini TaxID=1538125 RepID=A0AAV4P429_9ARAC|nr:hypothetical protein CDAR_74791 [Caerostris darwini]